MSPIDAASVRRAFSRAAAGYEATAVLQREVETRLLERLASETLAPTRVLDVGCGPGRATGLLTRRYRKAQVVALDWAVPMLRIARKRGSWWRKLPAIAADAHALPLAERSVDLIFSNLCLQWSPDLAVAFDEFRRVLRPGGLLLFSTFGPETLHELAAAWAAVDDAPHVNRFHDLAAVGDALMAAGFARPVVDREHFTLRYDDATTLMRELAAIGAGNADRARHRGLTGRRKLAGVLAAYEPFRGTDGRLPATYEVLYGAALAPADGQPRRRRGGGEIASFSVASLRGSRVPRRQS
jgi:malonyl-CoA O-methyltransferase